MRKGIGLFIVGAFLIHSFAFGSVEKELIRLEGNVQIRHIAESAWLSIFSSRMVEDTDWIRTHEASLARLDFHNGKESATIFERSLVQIDNVYPDKVSLRQWVGKIEVVVRHLFEKPIPVEVTTPSAVMAVRGSVADCRVLPDGTTYVNAKSGHIDVTAAGLMLSITGGQSVVVHPGAPPSLLKAILHPTLAPKGTTSAQNSPKSDSDKSKNDLSSNNRSPSHPRYNEGPPPGTIVTHNTDGTVTYRYTPNPGQEQPKEIPPGVVKNVNPDGTFTYTFTGVPGQPMGQGEHGASVPPSSGLATPKMPMNQPPLPGIPMPGAPISQPANFGPGTAVNGRPGPPMSGSVYFGAAPPNFPINTPMNFGPGTTMNGAPGAPMNGPVYGAPGLGTNQPTNYAAGPQNSGPPPGTVITNNSNGTTTYTYVWRPGMMVPTNIPPGVVATPSGNGSITYSITVQSGH